jgi:pimeloyl-ACP methyl ester carboxylesterase
MPDMTGTTERVRSADGTEIAFEARGDGPPLILVDPALQYRGFSRLSGLVEPMSSDFTVITYDRRGRGESGDTAPYSPRREVEDLAALIEAAAGDVRLYGFSSGALLAMHAVAAGLPVERIALLEPPIQEDADPDRPNPLTTELADLIAAGRNGDAVEHFNRSIGVPEEMVDGMRQSPDWPKLEAVAPTLVYDCTISDATTEALLRSVEVPALVLDSTGSSDDLSGWAASVAAKLPNAEHRSLAGEWHTVADEVIVPVLVEFLRD